MFSFNGVLVASQPPFLKDGLIFKTKQMYNFIKGEQKIAEGMNAYLTVMVRVINVNSDGTIVVTSSDLKIFDYKAMPHQISIPEPMKQLPKVKYRMDNKMSEPATAKQVEICKKITGVKYRKLTKGRASKIIGNTPASKSQIFLLKNNNYDISKSVTYAQFCAAHNELTKAAVLKINNK